MLHIIFRTYVTELLPLTDARFSFPLNFFRSNWYNFTKFRIYIDIDMLLIGNIIFRTYCNRDIALDCFRSSFKLNILRTNEWHFTKFYYADFSRLRLLSGLFHIFVTELWPFIGVFTARKRYSSHILLQFYVARKP